MPSLRPHPVGRGELERDGAPWGGFCRQAAQGCPSSGGRDACRGRRKSLGCRPWRRRQPCSGSPTRLCVRGTGVQIPRTPATHGWGPGRCHQRAGMACRPTRGSGAPAWRPPRRWPRGSLDQTDSPRPVCRGAHGARWTAGPQRGGALSDAPGASQGGWCTVPGSVSRLHDVHCAYMYDRSTRTRWCSSMYDNVSVSRLGSM